MQNKIYGYSCLSLSCFLAVLVYFSSAALAEDALPLQNLDRSQKALSEQIDVSQKTIESMSELDPSLKKECLENLSQATLFLTLSDNIQRTIAHQSFMIVETPKRLKQLEASSQNSLLPTEKLVSKAGKTGPAHFEKLKHKHYSQLNSLKAKIKYWSDRLLALKDSAQRQISFLPQKELRLIEIKTKLKKYDSAEKRTVRDQTEVLMLKAEYIELESEIALAEQNSQNYNQLVLLYRAEYNFAVKMAEHHEDAIQVLDTFLQKKRETDAADVLDKAQNAITSLPLAPKAVQDQLNINLQLSTELESLVKEEKMLQARYEENESQLDNLNKNFDMAKKRIEWEAVTDTTGEILRSQRLLLAGIMERADSQSTLINRIGGISDRQIRLEQLEREISFPESFTRKVMKPFSQFSKNEREKLKMEINDLIKQRKSIVDKLQAGYDRLTKMIQDIESSHNNVMVTAEKFMELLDRHLIWIRSSKPVDRFYFDKLKLSFSWMLSSSNWKQLLSDISGSIKTKPGIWGGGFLALIITLLGRRWIHRRIEAYSDTIDRQSDDSLIITVKAFSATLLLTVPWPLFLGFAGYQLSKAQPSGFFTIAFIHGLYYTAKPFFFWFFVYNVCRPKGLLQTHFQYPEPVRLILEKNLRWLIPVTILSSFLLGAMEAVPGYGNKDSLAILNNCIWSVATSIFLARVLRFEKGITGPMIRRREQSSIWRFRYIWYCFSFTPLIVMLLSVSGYYYSAVETRTLLGKTIGLAFIVMIFHAFAIRILKLARRRVLMKKRSENKAFQEKVAFSGVKLDKLKKDAVPQVFDTVLNMNEIDEHNRALLKMTIFIITAFGLWTIWEHFFPALGFFQDIQFWEYETTVNGAPKTVPIRLGNILMSIIIIFSTVFAVRNLPGLLEVILLSKLDLDLGTRYAYSTVCRYAITALGIIISLNTIGLRWANLQWLIAALGVGLGFGLQEIVANFISGLIVLFERPFRIGDTVTVGGTTGTVNRIQIRATTIMDWDMKELIVPNKEFITGQLINWSLSDKRLRVIIPVGIAYGSDTDLAEKLMEKAIKSTSLILKNPPPSVVMVKFGENTLDYELRVFIGHIDDWVAMRHALHKSIERAFRAEGITIAFPQRDIHLDTTGPLSVQILPVENSRSCS